MITSLHWTQHGMAITLGVYENIIFINPRPKHYILTCAGWHLCHIHTDGTDETGDIENAITLCRLHYQHSFSGDT